MITLKTPDYYSLQSTVLSHGWVNLAPYSWDHSGGILMRDEYLPNDKITVKLHIKQTRKNKVSVWFRSPAPVSKDSKKYVVSRVQRALCLDVNTKDIYTHARRLDADISGCIRNGGGRFLRGMTLFEDVVKTLLTTNASWSFTKLMVKNLIAHYGTQGSFPSPDNLITASVADLRAKIKMGYRARYLSQIVSLFLSCSDESEIVHGKIPGLGKYGITHVRVLNGDYSAIPIDSEVRDYCSANFSIHADSDIVRHYSRWGKYMFIGYKLERHVKGTNWIG